MGKDYHTKDVYNIWVILEMPGHEYIYNRLMNQWLRGHSMFWQKVSKSKATSMEKESTGVPDKNKTLFEI